MRLTVVAVAAFLAAFTVSSSRAELFHQWSYGYGDSLIDAVERIAVDTDGSVVVAGFSERSPDFGGGPLVGAGLYDIFIARFDAGMQHVWSRRFGDSRSQVCRAMALAPNGDLVVAGYFGGTVDFGGGSLVSVDDLDVFVARFDVGGAHVWSRGFPRASSQVATGVAVDAAGDVLVAGYFAGRIDFGGGFLISSGQNDAFLVKFGAGGAHLWSKRFGDGVSQTAQAVSVDGAGNVVLAGDFFGTIDLGGGPLTSAGDTDVFLASWDAAGVPRWSRRYGDAASQSLTAAACAPEGDVLVTGAFKGEMDFGGGAITAQSPPDPGAFLAALDADAAHRWSVALPGTTVDMSLLDLSVRPGGDVLAAGWLRGTHTFQGVELDAQGGEDLLLLVLDDGGNVIEAIVTGGSGGQSAQGVTAGLDGEIIVTGHFVGNTVLGADTLVYSGSRDIFIAAYGPNDPEYTPIAGFSAVLRDGVVEVRWQLAIEDPATTYRVLRRTEPDGAWSTLAGGPVDPDSRAYDDAAVVGGRTYSYQLQVTSAGVEYASRVATVQVPRPGPSLLQNAPNPFAGVTAIGYSLSRGGSVTIQIYDAAGRRIIRLDEGFRPAGAHEAAWDGRDASGQPVASGVYFYRLEGRPDAGARKMLLVR